MAEQYIAQGALWNGGVFAYKLSYVMDKAHELMDFTDYQDLFDKYDTMKKISFDYAVAEHVVCAGCSQGCKIDLRFAAGLHKERNAKGTGRRYGDEVSAEGTYSQG